MPMTDEIDESAKKGSETRSELGALESLVSLPRKPETIRWENDDSKTGDNSSLIVLMHFSAEDYKFIIENSRKFEVQNDELVDKAFYERWLKERLPSTVQVTSQGDFVILQDIHAMEPNLFTQADLSPYIHGRMIPLGEGHVVLSLYTM